MSTASDLAPDPAPEPAAEPAAAPAAAASASNGVPHVLIACDKFKGSLTAREVIDAIAAGIGSALPTVAVSSVIVADGGDGTLAAAYAAGFAKVSVTCAGPTGEPVHSAYALRGRTAVVEMADACGLVRLPGGERQPMTATSRGLGEVIAAALDAGIDELVIGIGGSASTDGGAGMMRALGARLIDGSGHDLPEGGGALRELARVDLSGLDPRLARLDITVACDVDNPLLGDHGAAAIFGPQKGATPAQVADLDAGLTRLSSLVSAALGADVAGAPGAGAAGGVGWAALAVLGATMRPGIELVLELARFEQELSRADLVVTGEGSLDEQTLLGKAPAGVARAATRAGVPVVALCGRSLLPASAANAAGIRAVYALADLEPDPQICMRDADRLLRDLAATMAREQLGAPH